MRRTDILERKEDILKWIEEDLPNAEIARRLACKVDTLKSYYTKMGITYSGNKSGKGSAKEHKCECCGLISWNDKPIPLELHHIDGNHYNNDLSNLQILCPNCHAQTSNYSCKK